MNIEEDEKMKEFVEAYYYSKTGKTATDQEILELMNEIDDDTRSKVMALSKESEKEILKQETNDKFVKHYEKASSKTWNHVWLIISGVFIGLMSAYGGQMNDEQRSEIFHMDRQAVADEENDFQKATTYVLVGAGFILSLRRYYYLTIDQMKPTTKIEKRMAACLFINIIFLFRLWYMISHVKRLIPWWEALVTGFGMTILQPLFMGLCALPIYQRKPNAKERSTFAVFLMDICCCCIACFGIVLSTYSEYQRSEFLKINANTLFTGGLFHYARHINYTGEVVLFAGWAMLTRSRYALIVPFFFFTTFHSFYVPDLDLHLKNKYTNEYKQWVTGTPWTMLPYVI